MKSPITASERATKIKNTTTTTPNILQLQSHNGPKKPSTPAKAGPKKAAKTNQSQYTLRCYEMDTLIGRNTRQAKTDQPPTRISPKFQTGSEQSLATADARASRCQNHALGSRSPERKAGTEYAALTTRLSTPQAAHSYTPSAGTSRTDSEEQSTNLTTLKLALPSHAHHTMPQTPSPLPALTPELLKPPQPQKTPRNGKRKSPPPPSPRLPRRRSDKKKPTSMFDKISIFIIEVI